MGRRSLIFLGVASALLGGLLWTGSPRSDSVLQKLETSPYTESSAYYEISVQFPTETALSGPANNAAVLRMKTALAGLIQEFKRNGDFENLSSEDVRMRGFDQGRKESLKILFFESVTPHADAYVFTIYEDTGGAHGNTYFKTFMFDKNTGTELQLANLFKPDVNYLRELSRLARLKLPETIGEYADASAIANGTHPKEDNFGNFVFDGKDLLILFPPYQVAAYAEGPITLRLTSVDLGSILESNYP